MFEVEATWGRGFDRTVYFVSLLLLTVQEAPRMAFSGLAHSVALPPCLMPRPKLVSFLFRLVITPPFFLRAGSLSTHQHRKSTA